MAEKILVIEDEKAIADLISLHLKGAGYEAVSLTRGEEAIAAAKKTAPILVILDLMLPGIDGMEVLRRLKRDSGLKGIPVIILTARGSELDRVTGLEVGAADYVTKPFSPRELVLRVKGILERTGPKVETGKMPSRFQCGSLEADFSKPLVLQKGKPVPLTPLELKLLQHLYGTRGHVQSREVLLDRVWGYNSDITTRTVDAHVKRLREKLGSSGSVVETVRGLGYRFGEEPKN